MSVWAKIKELFRKRLVHLKRKPQLIPTLFIIISCMVYTFRLSNFSNAAIYASDFWVAIFVFLTTLFSILSIFTYLRAFDRKKVKYVMIVLCLIQLLALFVFDFMTYGSLSRKIAEGSERPEIHQAVKDLRQHMIFLCISFVLVITRPVFRTLLSKIDTSVKDSEFDDERCPDEDTDDLLTEDDGE